MPAPKNHPPYNKNGEGGRPEKYDAKFIENEAEAFEKWMKLKTSLWYEDFCLERGYSPDYLSEWSKKNVRFFGVYKRAQVWQKSLLIRGGLLNKLNASIVKLVLANTIGWGDRQQIDGDAVNPLAFLLKNIDGTSKELVKNGNEQGTD